MVGSAKNGHMPPASRKSSLEMRKSSVDNNSTANGLPSAVPDPDQSADSQRLEHSSSWRLKQRQRRASTKILSVGSFIVPRGRRRPSLSPGKPDAAGTNHEDVFSNGDKVADGTAVVPEADTLDEENEKPRSLSPLSSALDWSDNEEGTDDFENCDATTNQSVLTGDERKFYVGKDSRARNEFHLLLREARAVSLRRVHAPTTAPRPSTAPAIVGKRDALSAPQAFAQPELEPEVEPELEEPEPEPDQAAASPRRVVSWHELWKL